MRQGGHMGRPCGVTQRKDCSEGGRQCRGDGVVAGDSTGELLWVWDQSWSCHCHCSWPGPELGLLHDEQWWRRRVKGVAGTRQGGNKWQGGRCRGRAKWPEGVGGKWPGGRHQSKWQGRDIRGRVKALYLLPPHYCCFPRCLLPLLLFSSLQGCEGRLI